MKWADVLIHFLVQVLWLNLYQWRSTLTNTILNTSSIESNDDIRKPIFSGKSLMYLMMIHVLCQSIVLIIGPRLINHFVFVNKNSRRGLFFWTAAFYLWIRIYCLLSVDSHSKIDFMSSVQFTHGHLSSKCRQHYNEIFTECPTWWGETQKKPQRRNAVQCRSRLASNKWNFLFKQVFQRNDFVDALDQELGRASISLAG